MNVNYLLDTAKSMCGLPTDLALAARLGVTKQAVSNWRQGDKLPDVVACEKLANMAGLKPLEVIASIYEQREISRDAKAVWKRLASAAVYTAIAVGGLYSGWNLAASPAPHHDLNSNSSIHYAKYKALYRFVMRKTLARFLRAFSGISRSGAYGHAATPLLA